uniref:6-pyruvoyl trahydropterin synthase family protein n=1 Tax=Ephemeroptericola cinctiostellae TaxID=2268024 RepID=UPI003570C80F
MPLCSVEVFETSTAGSRRDAKGFTIWKEVRFEAAQPFDGAGRYTGHSYLARLYLQGETLDAQAGWLRDFADVKAVFKPIYNQLDHYALDAIADLTAYDSATLAAWMATQLSGALPELSRVDVFENESSGAAVFVQEGA